MLTPRGRRRPDREDPGVRAAPEPHFLSYLAALACADIHPKGSAGTRRLLGLLDLRDESRVLDLGCGTGATLARIARSRRAVPAIGIDRHPGMLRAARARLRLGRAGRGARLVRGDALRLPLRDGSWDRIYAESVLGYQDARTATAMLREIHRVLAPGGRYVGNEALWKEGVPEETVARLNERCIRDFGLRQAPEHPWTSRDWVRLMEEAGFRVRAAEPAGDPDPGGPAPHLSALAGSLDLYRRARSLVSPPLIARRWRYRRLLRAHRSDGRWIAAWLFVLEKPQQGGARA